MKEFYVDFNSKEIQEKVKKHGKFLGYRVWSDWNRPDKVTGANFYSDGDMQSLGVFRSTNDAKLSLEEFFSLSPKDV